jgi:lipopolysaccharide biosynthesis glycosyltransferase
MEFSLRVVDQYKEVVKLKRYTAALPVCYCFDRAYANFTAVSSFSLHVNSLVPPKIYWIVPNRDFEYCLDLLNTINKFGIDITLIKLNTDHFVGWQGHYTAYYRLLLCALLDFEKIIYIDSDTLVLSSLDELFNHDLGENLVAGVIDPGGHTSNVFSYMGADEPYLNAGLLIMNLKKMREFNFIQKCESAYDLHKEQINYGDQDVLNLVSKGQKLAIKNKFCRSLQVNDETYDNFESAVKGSNILHFVGGIKPWMRCANKRAYELWWDYADKLQIPDLTPVEITNLTQVLFLAQSHDINQEYLEASRWKSKAIELLMRK